MGSKKKERGKNGKVGKLIELPEEAVENLEKLAKDEHMLPKPYMEKVLIKHSDKAVLLKSGK